MQTIEEIVGTPVIWVAAVHDDHTDKNHVHALASVQGRLEKPDVRRLIEVATQACREQRRELDRALSRQAQEQQREEWEPEPTLTEDTWED
jgi:hypothetical protein